MTEDKILIPDKVVKKQKPKGLESELKVASARAIVKEFNRRGWVTKADIRAHFREAVQVFAQANVKNLLALIKEE